MEYKVYRFNLDLKSPSYYAIQPKQGETGVKLIPTLVSDSLGYNLAGTIVNAIFRKPDNTVSYLPCAIEDAAKGIVSVVLTNQVLALPGKVDCEIQVTGDKGLVKSWTFSILVQQSVGTDEIESSNEFVALQAALETVNQYNNRIVNLEEKDVELEKKISEAQYSAPQEVTASVITLPDSVVEGQFSDVVLKGNTRINYINNSNMDKDSDGNGFVDGFNFFGVSQSVTATFSFDAGNKAQKIEITDSTGTGVANTVHSNFISVTPGEIVSYSVEAKAQVNSGSFRGTVMLVLYDANKNTIGTTSSKSFTNSEFTTIFYNNITIPNGVAYIHLRLSAEALAAGDKGVVWYRNALLEKAASVGNYISSGVKSTESVRVTSTINLFDWQGELAKSNLLTYEIYNNRRCLTYLAGGYAEQLQIGKGKFEGYKQYTITGQVAVASGTTTLLAKYTDGTSDTISFIATQTFASFKYTSIAGKTLDYICGTWNAGQKVYLDIDTFQIVEGTDEKEYSPYGIGGEAYIDYVGSSLPNGVKDEKNVTDGKGTQRTGEIILNGSENWQLTAIHSINSNLLIFDVPNLLNPSSAGWNYSMDTCMSNIFSGHYGWKHLVDSDYGEGIAVSTTNVRIVIDKSRLSSADLAGFKAWLTVNPVTLIYQLATEISEKGTAQALTAYPNGHIIVEPVVKEVNTYNNGITIKKAHLPIKVLESVYVINSDNSKTAIDISTCTIAPDGKSFTSTALTNSDNVEYTYFYDSSLTTLPTIRYSYPLNMAAALNENTKAIGNISESLADLWLYVIGGV